MTPESEILIDLGERRILRELIPKFVSSPGDDCAIIALLDGYLTVTTDPVPPPAARVIGGDPDLYWLGWLLVTINASDTAASGAQPLAFVAALDLPIDLSVREFERLLLGIKESCAANGLEYVGGNLREAPAIAAVGTAIGTSKKPPLRRFGAEAGDAVVVIGTGGRFWADVARHHAGRPINKRLSPLFAPLSQAGPMHRAHAQGLIKCAMDTSDGLAPSLYELAGVNALAIDIDLASIRAASSTDDIDVRPERLWMGWGDWTVLAAVSPNNVAALREETRGACTTIGSFRTGGPEVTLIDADRAIPLGRLESERFARDSWFSTGIEGYMKLMNELPLP